MTPLKSCAAFCVCRHPKFEMVKDVFLVFNAFSFLGGLRGVLYSLAYGAVVPFIVKFDLRIFLKAIVDFQVENPRIRTDNPR